MLLLKGTLLDTLVATIVALIGVITLNFALEGYCLRRLSWWERFLMIPAGAAILEPSWLTTYIGLGLFAALIVFQIIRLRQDNSEIEIPTTTETEAGG